MNARSFFTTEQTQEITDAIKKAELNTSGEIRLHVESSIKGDILDHAAFMFKTLKMHKTELRNGVLILLALKNRKFAIIGDVGINTKVPEDFWESVKCIMSKHFKEGDFTKGLSEGILAAGEKLREHFPYQSDDVNELSDEISFGKSK